MVPKKLTTYALNELRQKEKETVKPGILTSYIALMFALHQRHSIIPNNNDFTNDHSFEITTIDASDILKILEVKSSVGLGGGFQYGFMPLDFWD